MKSKKKQDLSAQLYDPNNVLDRENYVNVNGGLAELANKSDVTYNDTHNLGTNGWDQYVISLLDVSDSKADDDKPA
jgi:hypothetical protein